ncbi:MAG: hypothetical protein KKD39_01575, partial [Candidatus Altiarchaeota archaeon]|nr:hypothetical protein [Candidatus Altiarchaeota archaeon]
MRREQTLCSMRGLSSRESDCLTLSSRKELFYHRRDIFFPCSSLDHILLGAGGEEEQREEKQKDKFYWFHGGIIYDNQKGGKAKLSWAFVDFASNN